VRMLCLTKYTASGPSSRYRLYQFLPFFKEAGFQVEIQSLHNDDYLERMFAGDRLSKAYLLGRGLRRARKLLAAWRFDLVFVQKEIFPSLPSFVDHLLRVGQAKLVVDLDDAIFCSYQQRSSGLGGRLVREKVPNLLRRSTVVLAGNSYLKSYAERFANNVVLFPTVVDSERFRSIKAHREPSQTVCGWIGSPATVGYLRLLAPVLERLAKSERFSLRVIGADTFTAVGVPVESRPWSEDNEVEDLAGIDIGLMPLDASDWSEGKCGLKLLQYMSMSIPSLSSPRGTAREVITDGVNGYLADTPQEWYEKLQRLIRDPELRRTMGARGRQWIQENYNLHKYGPILVSQLTSVVGKA